MRFICAALLALTSSLAFAQSLEYATDPEEIDFTLGAGEERSFDLTISIANHEGSIFYDFRFIDRFIEGDEIPASWISSEEDSVWYFEGFSDPASSLMTISVPPETPSGIYEGTLFVKVRHGFHGWVELPPGDGVPIRLTVPGICTENPELHVESDTTYLWPPNGKYHDINISGVALAGEGCNLSEINYVIEDEYGELNSSGTIIATEDGSFHLSTALIAQRDGKDKDGRHYRVTLNSENENGPSEASLLIVVPHDQRKQ